MTPEKAASKAKERTHLACAVFFLIQIPWALGTNVKNSVPYLVFLSLWALVSGHLAGYAGERAAREAAAGGK